MGPISSSMTLLEIIEKLPDTEKIFRQYEQLTGSCLLCNHLFDSLESVASQYNLALDELLSRLQLPIKQKG